MQCLLSAVSVVMKLSLLSMNDQWTKLTLQNAHNALACSKIPLSIQGFVSQVGCNLGLPPVTILKQLLLVIQQLLQGCTKFILPALKLKAGF